MTVHNRQLLHDFTVEGTGQFPLDMLRFDECWPQRIDDACDMGDADSESRTRIRRTIRLRGIKAPTPARWASFGWQVIEEDGA